jgi:2-polyprenyl-3-methyl-5-hydroxy-6-metoxy-1,4-benzoquinol methylase
MTTIFERSKELRKLWSGFQGPRVLLTANNYKVFDHLMRPQSAKAISKKLNTDRRATEILLDALTGLSLLKKQNGKYMNTNMASQFLVSGSPHYQGDILKHADILWQNWSGLDKVIKTGTPYHKAQNHGAFILGMHNLAILKAKDVLKIIGLKGVKTALDLGGGPGTYSIEMAKKGISVTLFDRPETVEIAKRVISREGVKGIDFISGDFLKDDFGRGYDLIFLSQVLHSYSEKDNINLLKKCRKALSNNGRVVIQEFLINEDRTHPLQSALFSINMLVNTEGGRCYSPDEMKGWLLKAGLKNIKEKFFEDAVLIEGCIL